MEEIVVDAGSDALDPNGPDNQEARMGKRRSSRKRVAELQASATDARMAALSPCVGHESLACAHDFDPAGGDGL